MSHFLNKLFIQSPKFLFWLDVKKNFFHDKKMLIVIFKNGKKRTQLSKYFLFYKLKKSIDK
jgi:hypothetical protein